MASTCDFVWPPKELSLFTGTVSCLFFLVICLGNTLIVLAVVMDPLKKLRSPFNYFVANLAVSDLIVGVICMPTAIYYHFAEYLIKRTDLVVRVFHLSLFISLTASILCHIVLSMDRYISITLPIWYRNNMTFRKCWLCSFFVALGSLTVPFTYLKVGYINYLMIYANTAVIIAMIILVITYYSISHFLKKRAEKTKTSLVTRRALDEKHDIKQEKITKLYLKILLLFLLCYTPATVFIYVMEFCSTCSCLSIHILRDITYILATANSCVNPFIYATTYKHYRRAIMVITKYKHEENSVQFSSIISENVWSEVETITKTNFLSNLRKAWWDKRLEY